MKSTHKIELTLEPMESKILLNILEKEKCALVKELDNTDLATMDEQKAREFNTRSFLVQEMIEMLRVQNTIYLLSQK